MESRDFLLSAQLDDESIVSLRLLTSISFILISNSHRMTVCV